MGLGLKMGLRLGVGTGDADAPAASATRDATSNIYIPQNASEFGALGLATPAHLWRFHAVSSGNINDDIGGKTLNMSGSPTYSKAISGWTSTAIGASGAAANQFANNNTMENINATSVLLVAYALITTPTGVNPERMHHGAANINSFQGANGTGNIRLRTNANSGNGVTSHTGAVHPFVILFDITNSANVIYSDVEKKAITYAAAAGTEVSFQFGVSADTASSSSFIWACEWTGSDAEKSDAQIKAILQALGWTVSGY